MPLSPHDITHLRSGLNATRPALQPNIPLDSIFQKGIWSEREIHYAISSVKMQGILQWQEICSPRLFGEQNAKNIFVISAAELVDTVNSVQEIENTKFVTSLGSVGLTGWKFCFVARPGDGPWKLISTCSQAWTRSSLWKAGTRETVTMA